MRDYRQAHSGGLENNPENPITERVIKCAIEVHKQLGPGLLENMYETAMEIECKLQGLAVKR